MNHGLEFAVLGPFEVAQGDRPLGPAGAKRRGVLAMLVLRGNHAVPVGDLVEGLWADDPPPSAANVVQTYISAWRKAVEPDPDARGEARRLATVGPAYRLRIEPGELDLDVFMQARAEGAAAAAKEDHERAAARFSKALALWHGPPLADLAGLPFHDAAATRLAELRLQALEAWAAAILACGDARQVVARVREVRQSQPLRERLSELLMWALLQDGRQAEALAVYEDTRRLLADELGADPGPGLRDMHARVLRQDPALHPAPQAGSRQQPGAAGRFTLAGSVPAAGAVVVSAAGAAATAEAGEGLPAVQTLSFLLTDIEGSTGMLRRLGGGYAAVLADHHRLIREALAAHGAQGVVARGDGFFAVFGTARACAAAAIAIQKAIAAHSWPADVRLRARIGMHSGEAEQTAIGLVGMEVHRGARMAEVAHGGQVLVSSAAAALVGDALPDGARLRDLGMHRLKDLGRPEQIFQLDAPGLPAAFPPLRSLGNPALPNNLPAQLATFIGRDRELEEVRAVVASSRLVTLTGPGGCGKTRLSLQMAAGLLDGSGDGVWLVELAAVTSEDAVAPAICQALGIAGQPGRPVLETLLDALAPQDVLIVLDNCEHLIGACAKTADAIVRHCPKVHLVATSREPLSIGGETIYRVPPLSLPEPGDGGPPAPGSSDAVALFLERAREQGVPLSLNEETGPLIASTCVRLDGLPLAIELAAARLRSLSLSALNDRLGQRFSLLTGGSRTAQARQQTLQAAVDWSYSLLNPAEKLLLRRLPVFAESFDLDAAETVCGFGDIEASDVAGLLGSLVDKSLVVAEPAGRALRYRLLETIRQFAADRLAEADDGDATEVAAAHCRHYLSVAETTAPYLNGPDPGPWLSRLDADQANLRRAAEHAVGEPGGTSLVLRFGIALLRYWGTRHRHDQAALLVRVLERPEAAADPPLFAQALVAAADRAADNSTALQLAQQADQVASALGDNRLLVLTRRTLCETYTFTAEWELAGPPGQESVERGRELGDDVQLGQSLLAYATALRPAESGPQFAEAIACTERSGDLLTSLKARNNAGFRALGLGDTPAARALLESTVRDAEAIGVSHLVALGNLADVLRAEQDFGGARSGFERVVRMGRRAGNKYALVGAILGLACLAGDLGDWRRAAVLYGAEHALADQIGYRWNPFDARRRRESLDQARAALSDEQLEQAYARGMALSFDQAIDLALGGVLPDT